MGGEGVNVNQGKVKVNLNGVSQTLLAPLRGRAQVSKEYQRIQLIIL
jgi:O-methyltransferase involved in polyketide biosynthesis